MDILRNWFKSTFNNPQLLLLIIILLGLAFLLILTADILAPLLVAIVLSFLLQVFIDKCVNLGLSKILSTILVLSLFLLLTISVVFVVIPLFIRQVIQLTRRVPDFLEYLQQKGSEISSDYPNIAEILQPSEVISQLQSEVLGLSQSLIGSLGGTVVDLFTLLVYLIIVPLMMFLLIKDREKFKKWFASFLPRERGLSKKVWTEVHNQLQNYVGGKVLEIFIVSVVSYVSFTVIGLQYAILLAVITGLSVLIPYIGAALVTIPVAVVAVLQWGFSGEAGISLLLYAIIQAVDGNLLAPFLFSEAVNIHPLAIIVAIIFFGGIWGFWGVFFAIPLAVVVHAVIRAWPS